LNLDELIERLENLRADYGGDIFVESAQTCATLSKGDFKPANVGSDYEEAWVIQVDA